MQSPSNRVITSFSNPSEEDQTSDASLDSKESPHNVSVCSKEDFMRSLETKLLIQQFKQNYQDGATASPGGSETDSMAQANMSFTFDMMNKLQIPKNHQGLVGQLPIHINPLDADLYTETKSLTSTAKSPFSPQTVKICFKPVPEFISMNLGPTSRLSPSCEGTGAEQSPERAQERKADKTKEPDMIE